MKTTFFLDLIPPNCTSQMKGQRVVTGRGKPFVKHYKKKVLSDVEKLFKYLLLEHKPASPIVGVARVSCAWIFPWRKTELKRVTKKYSRIPKTTKPDAGNSNKLLIDCMTDVGFWLDDAQIFCETAKKYWGDTPGIIVTIETEEGMGYTQREQS